MDKNNIRKLLGDFSNSKQSSFDQDRENHLKYYSKICTREYVNNANEDEIFNFFRKLYSFKVRFIRGGENSVHKIIKANILPIKYFIIKLLFCDFDSIDKVWDESQKNDIPFVSELRISKAVVSEILMFSHPDDFLFLNNKTIPGIHYLGFNTNIKNGKNYKAVCDEVKIFIGSFAKEFSKIRNFYYFDNFVRYLSESNTIEESNVLKILEFVQLNQGGKYQASETTRNAGRDVLKEFKNLMELVGGEFDLVEGGRPSWQNSGYYKALYGQLKDKQRLDSTISIMIHINKTENVTDKYGEVKVGINIDNDKSRKLDNPSLPYKKVGNYLAKINAFDKNLIYDFYTEDNKFHRIINGIKDEVDFNKIIADENHSISIYRIIKITNQDNKSIINEIRDLVASLLPIYNDIFDGKVAINNGQSNLDVNHGLFEQCKSGKISYNSIFYGVPGCGKSYRVNQVVKNSNLDPSEVYRVTFYPDYSNADFVGQVMPKLDQQTSKVSYEFVEGPFTKALKQAYSNPDRDVALIIEEINRGNAAAIFGDIFQLLDRNDGISEYAIKNFDISRELYNGDENRDILLPKNMYILATMNTSDQNVFPLDTAFKRRWELFFVENGKADFGEMLVPDLVFNGEAISWNRFVDFINNQIVNYGNSSINTNDKQIGAYFVSKDDLVDKNYTEDELKIKRSRFVSKVYQYLYSDVFVINPQQVFLEKNFDATLKKLCNSSDKIEMSTIFSSAALNSFK